MPDDEDQVLRSYNSDTPQAMRRLRWGTADGRKGL
jgi:hypothetical protein